MKHACTGKMHRWFCCLLAVAGLAGSACDDGLTVGFLDPDGGSHQGQDDGPSDDVAIDASRAASLPVALRVEPIAPDPDDPELCKEDCANVTASVQTSEAFTVTWSDPSLKGLGPHRVCTAKTPLTITVDAQEEGTGEEFGPAQAHGSAVGEIVRSKLCACRDREGVIRVHDVFVVPEAGDNYHVCAGNPKPIPASALYGYAYQMLMYSGDSFAVALERPLLPNEAFAIGGAFDIIREMSIHLTTSWCGNSLQELENPVLSSTVRSANTTGQTITHLTFEVGETRDVPMWTYPPDTEFTVGAIDIDYQCWNLSP